MSKKAIQLWLDIKREYPIGSYAKVKTPITKTWILARVVAYSSTADNIPHIRFRPVEFPNLRVEVKIEAIPANNIIKQDIGE